MRKIVLTVTFLALILFGVENASATLSWVYSPDSNQTGDLTTQAYWDSGDLIIGTSTSETLDEQPLGIYGAGAALPKAYNDAGFHITLDTLFKTWDSYNDSSIAGNTGYWDSFSATITKGNYYWNKSLSDPINGDVEQILVLHGGTNFGDAILEEYSTPWTQYTFVPTDTTSEYYLNLVIDTKTLPDVDVSFPSWGEFSNVQVDPIPEPATMLLFGSGLLGLVGLGKARRKKKRS